MSKTQEIEDRRWRYWRELHQGVLRERDMWKAKAESLEEQVQSLELACDHHKMFWQRAEERERGLKEQLEASRMEAEEFRSRLNWIYGFADELRGRHTGFVHIARRADLASNPASEREASS